MIEKIAVIGLGYVGLPLARLFSTKYPTVGFDISKRRIDELMSGKDVTLEVTDSELVEALEKGFICTNCLEDISDCNIYIVTVPTPISTDNTPDLTPLIEASEMIGAVISQGNVVVFESTVFPGATEEVCVPIIERVSRLTYNVDFFAGYSPERVNPGDKSRRVEQIMKVTSGSTPETAEFVDKLYRSVLTAGTHKAPSIKVAEASKVIENTQRDVNIAFFNEIAQICSTLNIDTNEVVEAASTKWNFVKLSPGLVGGHCIGVDPYYLIDKSSREGFLPHFIATARQVNNEMPEFVVNEVIRLMNLKGVLVKDADVLILGYTFKENCPDVRNSKVKDMINVWAQYTSSIEVHDPWVTTLSTDVRLIEKIHPNKRYDVVILAVAHDDFKEMDVRSLTVPNGVVYDLKGILPLHQIDGRL